MRDSIITVRHHNTTHVFVGYHSGSSFDTVLYVFQIFLLLGGQTGQISTGSDTNDATNEPTSLTLGLSVLALVLLWMFLPHIAVCAVICLGWKAQQHIH